MCEGDRISSVSFGVEGPCSVSLKYTVWIGSSYGPVIYSWNENATVLYVAFMREISTTTRDARTRSETFLLCFDESSYRGQKTNNRYKQYQS